MRILSLEEFRKMPEGTVFMKYEPCVFEDLQVKGETWETDFIAANITYCTGSGDFSDKLFAAQKSGESILLDFDCYGRDGCFEKGQLFAVYEKRDIKMLIDKLNRCLAISTTLK